MRIDRSDFIRWYSQLRGFFFDPVRQRVEGGKEYFCLSRANPPADAPHFRCAKSRDRTTIDQDE